MNTTADRRYPRFSLRLQAAMLDAVILPTVFVLSAVFIGQFAIPAAIKIAFVVFMVLFFEPGLVSLTGSSVGHFLRGLKVEAVQSRQNLGLLRSLARFVVKSVIGLYSLVAILATRKRQAVHNAAAGSVVVLRHPEKHARADQLLERDPADSRYDYPSRIRRAAVVILWAFLLIAVLVALLIAVEITLSRFLGIEMSACVGRNLCNAIATVTDWVIGVSFFAGACWLVYLGANGRLLGARRSERVAWTRR